MTTPSPPVASQRAIPPGLAFTAYGRVIQPAEIEQYRAKIGDESALVELLTSICQIRSQALGTATA